MHLTAKDYDFSGSPGKLATLLDDSLTSNLKANRQRANLFMAAAFVAIGTVVLPFVVPTKLVTNSFLIFLFGLLFLSFGLGVFASRRGGESLDPYKLRTAIVILRRLQADFLPESDVSLEIELRSIEELRKEAESPKSPGNWLTLKGTLRSGVGLELRVVRESKVRSFTNRYENLGSNQTMQNRTVTYRQEMRTEKIEVLLRGDYSEPNLEGCLTDTSELSELSLIHI